MLLTEAYCLPIYLKADYNARPERTVDTASYMLGLTGAHPSTKTRDAKVKLGVVSQKTPDHDALKDVTYIMADVVKMLESVKKE
jgi:hypothetical protein